MAESQFVAADYVVMVLMLLVSSVIGIFFAWRDRRDVSNKAFLMGNRKLGVFPVAMSLMASFQSATTVLGYPAEMFYKGTQFWVAIFGLAISNLVAAELFLPVMYNLHLTSVNLYLEKRFNSVPVKVLGSLSFIINTLLYMGVVLYGPAVALESVTGLPVWSTIIFLGLICTFYTTLGGMKAVVWTDVIQMSIMMLGLASVCIVGIVQVGGISEVWRISKEGGRVQFFNSGFDLHDSGIIWNVLLGTSLIWMASYGTSQTQVQRFCSVSTLNKAKLAMYINIPGVMLNISLGCLAGLVIYANYYNCDPLQQGAIKKSDQLMPFFVMQTLGAVPGLPGLFVACVFSGALSTLSSGFNSLAAVTWEDFLKHFAKLNEKQAALFTKAIAAFYGFLTIGLAFIAGRVGSILKAAFAMSGALSGPLLGVFLLGVTFPFANGKGALVGLLLGQSICLWIVTGSLLFEVPHTDLPTSIAGCPANETFVPVHRTLAQHKHERSGLLTLYHVSHLLVPVFGFFITTISTIIVSFATGHTDPKSIDPLLLSRFVTRHLKYDDDQSKKEHEPLAITSEPLITVASNPCDGKAKAQEAFDYGQGNISPSSMSRHETYTVL